MGTISAGISAGILLSRFIGGMISEWFGWRAMLLSFAAFGLVAATLAWMVLPGSMPPVSAKQRSVLRTATGLLAQFPDLRWAAAAGMLWFAAFSAVWVGLAIELAQPPWSLSAEAIGLYSLTGGLGLIITPIAGRMADRFGPRKVKLLGLAVAAVSAMALCLSLAMPPFLMLALAFFDAGCFAAQVANQSAVVRLAPDRSGALMSTYLLFYYVAGAIGTAVAGPLVAFGGWSLLIGAVAAAIVVAFIVSASVRPAQAI